MTYPSPRNRPTNTRQKLYVGLLYGYHTYKLYLACLKPNFKLKVYFLILPVTHCSFFSIYKLYYINIYCRFHHAWVNINVLLLTSIWNFIPRNLETNLQQWGTYLEISFSLASTVSHVPCETDRKYHLHKPARVWELK